MLRDGLRLIERQEREEAARLAALRAAAETGWADVAAGRYLDVDDEDLDDFIGQLIGRILHDAMELRRHLAPEGPWE